MQSYSGFASLPLPGGTKYKDDQQLSLELGMRPCENLEPGLPSPALLRPALTCVLPCPALLCPALPYPAMNFVTFCCPVHCTACSADFCARKQTSSWSGTHFAEGFVCHACEHICHACHEAHCERCLSRYATNWFVRIGHPHSSYC